MGEITAYVGQVPQKFYQKKISKVQLIIVAIIAGSIGAYALINSFAATTCTPDLDHLTAVGCPVVKSDTAASGDPTAVDALWGNIECADLSRFQQIPTGGDPHNTAAGTPQGNDSYYKLTVLDGDNFYGERCELGRNERRYGENGGAGTFQLYQEGQHKITFVSIRLPTDFPANVDAWQTILQMKQTEPDFTAGGSPILEMQEFGNKFRIESDPAGELWTTPAVTGQWVRFAFDVTYSQDSSKGKLKVYADLNGDGDTLDPGEQSPVITTATLATETQTSLGDPPTLQPGDPVPGHLRLGLYHNPTYSCPAPNGCSINDDNIQVVDLTGISTTSTPSPPADTTAPSVSLTAPANSTTVSGSSVAVSATASDDTGVAGVQFKLDGNNLGSEDTTSPYSVIWDTTSATNGTHTLTAVARDAAGNTTTSSSITVTVANTTTLTCTKTLSTTDNIASAVNNAAAGAIICLNPGTYSQSPTLSHGGVAGSPVTLTSADPSNPALIAGRTVTDYGGSYININHLKFAYATAITQGNVVVLGTPYVNFTHNDVDGGNQDICINGVSYGGSTISYSLIDHNTVHDCYISGDNTVQGIYMLGGPGNVISNNWCWHVSARCYQVRGEQGGVWHNNVADDAGMGWVFGDLYAANNNVYNNIVGTVSGDSVNPPYSAYEDNSGAGNSFHDNCVSIPEALSSVTHYNNTVVSVQFVDAAHHNYNLSSASVNDPCRNYAVQGGDPGSQSGSTATSTPAADTTAPTVSFTAPANGSTVSGIVTSTAVASDNVGVTKVELSLDGSIKMTDITSPYNYSFDSKTLSNGNHTLTAKAYDAAGNASTATDTVNVSNSDITPPNAPTGLNATAANTTTVNLTWSATTDSGTNPTGVVKYNVLRNGVVIAQPTTTSYTDSGLTANTTYSYTVQAVDGAGNVSANSKTATVTTPAVTDTIAPTTPTNLMAAAVIGANQVNLTWNASTDSGGSGLAGYNIYRNGNKLNSSLVTTISYGDGTVSDGTTYSYTVQAVDGSGNNSAQTSAVSVTTADTTPPTAATNLRITSLKTTSVALAWNASTDNVGVTGYQVWRSGGGGHHASYSWTLISRTSSSTLSYTDSTVSARQTYYYAIKSYDAAGNVSGYSNQVQAKTPRR